MADDFLNIILLEAPGGFMACPASFAEMDVVIVDADASDFIALPDRLTDPPDDLGGCAVPHRTAVDHQKFHTHLRKACWTGPWAVAGFVPTGRLRKGRYHFSK